MDKRRHQITPQKKTYSFAEGWFFPPELEDGVNEFSNTEELKAILTFL